MAFRYIFNSSLFHVHVFLVFSFFFFLARLPGNVELNRLYKWISFFSFFLMGRSHLLECIRLHWRLYYLDESPRAHYER